MPDIKQKITLDGVDVDRDRLSDVGKAQLAPLAFVTSRMTELADRYHLLQRAKSGFIDDLKKEILSSKAGLLLGDD